MKNFQQVGGIFMGKINYFALFGVIFFNLVLFSGVAIAVVALLFSLWTVVVSFVLSPIILVVVNQMGIQEFNIIQTILSCIILVIGIKLVPFSMKATRYMGTFFTKYIEYNKKTIYSN
ncbi:DUF1700 domain-containing protein [Psychrobacillus sp. FSL K6-2836]|uniref:HAAS domain-containing protein n=2 Tax=Psychrobacillus sp. FSL K6-2836 TaxID=2921548 RepID=UPI0030F88419